MPIGRATLLTALASPCNLESFIMIIADEDTCRPDVSTDISCIDECHRKLLIPPFENIPLGLRVKCHSVVWDLEIQNGDTLGNRLSFPIAVKAGEGKSEKGGKR
jgi:hypothetical protein